MFEVIEVLQEVAVVLVVVEVLEQVTVYLRRMQVSSKEVQGSLRRFLVCWRRFYIYLRIS